MNAKPALLIILRSHEKIRTQYFNGIANAFPELNVNIVANVADADPFLKSAEIIVTHGPHLETRADHVFSSAKKLKWVQGIGTGVDGIADKASLRKDIIVTNIHGVHGTPMSEAAISLMLALTCIRLPNTSDSLAGTIIILEILGTNCTCRYAANSLK